MTAAGDAEAEGIPCGFRFLVTDDMKLVEPANLYLYHACVVSGTVESADTERTYAEGLYDWFQTCEDNGWRWDRVTAHEIALYRNRMLTQPSPATGRPYARRTINQRLGDVCRFYGWAFERGLIDRLPFTYRTVRVSRPTHRNMMAHLGQGSRTGTRNALFLKRKKPRVKALSSDEVKAILARLGPDRERPSRNRLMAEAAVVMGLRRMEVCALTVHQIPEAGMAGLGRIILEVTKGGRDRAVYPPAAFLDRLRWHVAIDRARIVRRMRNKLGSRYVEPAEAFLTEDGRPIARGYLSRTFHDAAKAAEVRGATFHWLRHTFALTMFKQLRRQDGVDPWKSLQVILGHQQLATTVDTYLDALEIDEAAIGDSVERLYEMALAAAE